MSKHNEKGMTLIEVLVVCLVIAVLFVILFPIHPHRHNHAKQVVCMSNQRQIALGWLIYAKDNYGLMLSADTFDNNTNWISGPTDENGQTVDWQNCSQEDEIRGIEQSLLYKYIGIDEVFYCPTAYTNKKHDAPLGYRSYSMPSTLNGTDLPEELDKYRYTMIDQIKEADKKFMVVEEADTRGFNYNGWFQNPETPDTITDSIGIFHSKSSNFAFCDGHAENVNWENPKTIEHFENYIETNTDGNFNFTDTDNEDIKLIHRYYPVKK